jgi:DNA mismatch endonuclease (patch repair protein)
VPKRKVLGRLGLVTDPRTSERLARIRQHGTTPELHVRKLVSKLGARFTSTNRDLPGAPDLANRTRRWAIFVHGCYWHSHQGCSRATVPKRNRSFWVAKFATNRARDARTVDELKRLGFKTLVIWECEAVSEERLTRRIARFLAGVSEKGPAQSFHFRRAAQRSL